MIVFDNDLNQIIKFIEIIMKNSIEEFIRNIPKAEDGMSKIEHHKILQDYLDEELPEEAFDEVNKIDELVSRSYIYPDLWLTRTIKNILQNDDSSFKFVKLLYFLENFYLTSIKYSSEDQTEELFTEAVEYSSSLQDSNIEAFLVGVYPDYVDEIGLEF